MLPSVKDNRKEQIQSAAEPLSRVAERLALLNPSTADVPVLNPEISTSPTAGEAPFQTASPGTIQIHDIPGKINVLISGWKAQTDQRLWSALQQAVAETGIPVNVTSGERSIADQVRIYGYARDSRHLHANALDIFPQSRSMADGDRLAQWFLEHGFTRGERGNKWGLLWRVEGHFNHLHISVRD